MVSWPRRRRDRRYFSEELPARTVMVKIADVVELNPDLIEGYLVVAFLVDGTIGVAHNCCCMPHAMTEVSHQMISSPDLMAPRDQFHKGDSK